MTDKKDSVGCKLFCEQCGKELTGEICSICGSAYSRGSIENRKPIKIGNTFFVSEEVYRNRGKDKMANQSEEKNQFILTKMQEACSDDRPRHLLHPIDGKYSESACYLSAQILWEMKLMREAIEKLARMWS